MENELEDTRFAFCEEFNGTDWYVSTVFVTKIRQTLAPDPWFDELCPSFFAI